MGGRTWARESLSLQILPASYLQTLIVTGGRGCPPLEISLFRAYTCVFICIFLCPGGGLEPLGLHFFWTQRPRRQHCVRLWSSPKAVCSAWVLQNDWRCSCDWDSCRERFWLLDKLFKNSSAQEINGFLLDFHTLQLINDFINSHFSF